MKLLKTIPLAIFVALNLLVVLGMIACAYTSWLPPQEHPHLAYYGLMFPVFMVADSIFVFFWLIFKWKVTLLPLAGLLICASSVRAYYPLNIPSDPPEGSIKILSYNVMAFGDEKGLSWNENPILLYLLHSGADIICLQEARKSIVDSALDSVSLFYPYHHYQLESDNYIACFSKFPIDSVSEIEYPSSSNHTFVYEILMGKDTLLVLNNHMESYKLSLQEKADYKSIIKNYQHPEENNSEEKYQGLTEKLARHDSIRGIQADSVASFLARNQHRNIIACGDLNSTPISYVHHRLTEYLDDAYTRSGNGAGTSYNRYGMYFRIDHILVSPNITAYGAKVDKSIVQSDHYPISCFVKLK